MTGVQTCALPISNGILAAVGQDGAILENTSGNWISGDFAGTLDSGTNLNAVTWWKSGSSYYFIAVGDNGTVATWIPGNSWTLLTAPTTYNLRGVTYDTTNNRLLVVGDNGTILYSTSITVGSTITVNWASITSGTTRNLYCIEYNSAVNYWVAGGEGITIPGQGTATISETQTWGNVYQNVDIQRVAYYGSYPYVGETTPVPPIQQQINNQTVAGSYIDTNPQSTATYYLVVGNLTEIGRAHV